MRLGGKDFEVLAGQGGVGNGEELPVDAGLRGEVAKAEEGAGDGRLGEGERDKEGESKGKRASCGERGQEVSWVDTDSIAETGGEHVRNGKRPGLSEDCL